MLSTPAAVPATWHACFLLCILSLAGDGVCISPAHHTGDGACLPPQQRKCHSPTPKQGREPVARRWVCLGSIPGLLAKWMDSKLGLCHANEPRALCWHSNLGSPSLARDRSGCRDSSCGETFPLFPVQPTSCAAQPDGSSGGQTSVFSATQLPCVLSSSAPSLSLWEGAVSSSVPFLYS